MTRLDFSGKEFVYNHHLSVAFSELKANPAKSLLQKGEQARKGEQLGLDGNLIVHGDNLRALKALLPRYEGRVNCIYIDPPYNTGNEGWCYNDNVNMPYLTEWLSNNPVDQEDMQRHEKWCCMMWPRLTLLRQLLAEDGVMFISIDDNEAHHLRMMVDEIFGEENFVASFLWRKKGTSTNVTGADVSSNADYQICYKKSCLGGLQQRVRSKKTRIYNNSDDLGCYRTEIIEKKNVGSYKRESMQFDILGQKPRYGKRWQIGYELAKELESKGRFTIEKSIVKRKIYDFEDKDTRSANPTYLPDECGNTDSANKTLQEILGETNFENPKPHQLIQHLIKMCPNDHPIILDSFAGSGTTAQAVLELNKEDGGSRKFILVECEDYADKITAERVRRVIKGVPDAKDLSLKNGLAGSFTFCELGEPIDFDKLLKADALPPYKEFAALVWNLFSDTAFDEKQCDENKFLIGRKDNGLVFCFYRPDKSFLLSNESCLNTTRMEWLASSYPDKEIVVYAPSCFVPNAMLAARNIKFAYLPFALFRLG